MCFYEHVAIHIYMFCVYIHIYIDTCTHTVCTSTNIYIYMYTIVYIHSVYTLYFICWHVCIDAYIYIHRIYMCTVYVYT